MAFAHTQTKKYAGGQFLYDFGVSRESLIFVFNFDDSPHLFISFLPDFCIYLWKREMTGSPTKITY